MFRLLYVLAFVSSMLLLGFSVPVLAQLNRGIIEGIVTDPQGALVPEVQVTVSSLDTNIISPTKTNAAGYYRVVDLVPGKYRAHFEAAGFSPVDVTDILVPAGQVIRTDAQLRLGATRESVQVTAELPLVDTAPANFSTTVESRMIQEVPLQGRDLQQLVFLVPGVAAAGPPGSNFGFNSQFGTFPDPTHLLGSDVSVNGGQAGSNAWYLDGNLNLSSMAQNVVVNPSPDAVSEFQVVTNAFSAEYGRTGGAIFNVVLKSGANRLHGNIYEFLRNDATNARNPFTSIDAFGHLVKDRQLRFNNFGGTLGGPVVIPHLYDGKNKTFFFFSWDESILHLLGNQVFNVPTPRMRQGDFGEDPNAASFGMWDLATTVGPARDGTFARSAFGTPVPGSAIGCTGRLAPDRSTAINPTSSDCNFATQIPTNRLDPTALFFMQSFPAPNYQDPLRPGCLINGVQLCNNFLGAVGSSQNTHNISLKIDHQWSEKSRYFGEWLFNPGNYNNYRIPWTGPTFPHNLIGWGSNYPLDFANQIIAFGNTYTFTPTLINEFHASFGRLFLSTHPSRAGYPDSVTGLSQVLKVIDPIKIPLAAGSPSPFWNMFTPAGGFITFGPSPWVNNTSSTEAYTILDNVTKIVGRHTVKAGFMYRLDHLAQEGSAGTYMDFYGGSSVSPTTGLGGGSGLAEFLLGSVRNDGSSFSAATWQPYMRWRYWGFYVQDDFRVTPRLTLNLGLRYDVFGVYKTRQHPDSRFCLKCPNSDTGLVGLVQYEGDPGFAKNSDLFPPNWTDFGPRLNFSWTPFADRKTVVRGSYDVFYSNAFESNNSMQSAPNGIGWAYDNYWQRSFNPNQCPDFSGQCLAWPLSDTTLDKGAVAVPPVTGTFPAQQRSQIYATYNNSLFKPAHDPMVQTWGLEVQRELPGNFALSIGYVGTHGTHLTGDTWRNYSLVPTAARLKYRNSLYDVVPITDYYSGRTADRLAQVWGASSLPRASLLVPYPFWPFVITTQAFNGTTIYHGMNVRVQKRYSPGLSLIAAYTVSKKINNPLTGQLFITTVDPLHLTGARPGYIGGRTGALANISGGILGRQYQDPDNTKTDRSIAPDDIPQMLNLSVTYELPFGSGRHYLNRKGPLNQLVGGWLLTANFNAQSGVPLSITCPSNGLTNRCNLIGDPHFSGSRSKGDRIGQWINPAAFEPAFGGDQSFWVSPNFNDDRWWQFGTSGLNLPGIRSPGFWNVDSALAKRFHISEDKFFEFRWEAFNALNHQNLGLPNTSFCLPPGPNNETDLVHQAGCQFGRITNIQTDPRSMEFALKFYW